MAEQLAIEHPDRCPKCGGETTFGFGLAGGGVEDEDELVVNWDHKDQTVLVQTIIGDGGYSTLISRYDAMRLAGWIIEKVGLSYVSGEQK